MSKTKLRTHNCGELKKENVTTEVELCGWVNSNRDHGGVIFIDLRDRYGITQLVFNPDTKNNLEKNLHAEADKLRREDVIKIKGKVLARGEGLTNPNLSTGEIEVIVTNLEMLGKAETPPIEVDDRIEASDEIRLKYRYLDLRRPKMQKNLLLRYNAKRAAMDYLHNNSFLEIETPMLVKSTPEGARDYVVPSRVNPGKFYALPQSPQLYKQILMVAGMDRYYQFPRCLRDEDLRADRQPEHTQIDLEMSFVTAEDIMETVEGMIKHIIKESLGIEIKEKVKIIPYDESIAKYGIDKPDIRFDLELSEVTDLVKESDFTVFKDIVSKGGIIKCINPESELPRKEIDGLINFCISHGAKGMAWMRVTENGLESNIAKYFSKEVQDKILERTGAKPGSVLMFIADKPNITNSVLAQLRLELGKRLKLYNPKEFKFCWITDFPLFEYDEEAGSWIPCHHIFSMPKKEHLKYLETEPGKVYADLFDLVLNGVELGSGSMRIHNPKIQKRVMDVIGLKESEAEKKFGFLLDAYKYGGPPHGGMGIGLDRFVALMSGTNDIREVIAFPKNKAGICPMDGSPNTLENNQLKELHIKTDIIKKAE